MVGFEVRAETIDDDLFMAFVQFFLNFFESKVDDIVVVHLQRRRGIAEPQPEPVEEIDFVSGQVRCVWSEDFVDLITVGQVDFQVKLRFRVAQLFPRLADLARLFFVGFPA